MDMTSTSSNGADYSSRLSIIVWGAAGGLAA
jgi:hypothetical protein